MALLDHDPISIPPGEAERVRIACNPHILKVDLMARVPNAEVPPKTELVKAIRVGLGPTVADFESVWGEGFFEGWAINLRTPGKTAGLYVENSQSVEILAGTFKLAIFLPSSLFPSTPNSSGRISSREPIEAPLQAALEIATYLVVRFLSGLFFGLGDGLRDTAELHAIEFLQPYFEGAAPIFFNTSAQTSADLIKDDKLQKIITKLRESGAARARIFYAEDIGNIQFVSGRNLAAHVKRENIASCPLFIDMAQTLSLIIDMRVEARGAHMAQRGIRTAIGSHRRPTRAAALANLSVPVDDAIDLAVARFHAPSLDEIVLLAREFDIDITDVFADQRYLQPLAAAWRAVGRYERRQIAPDADADGGLLALYGLRALKALIGPAPADIRQPAFIIHQIAPADDAILPRFPLQFSEV